MNTLRIILAVSFLAVPDLRAQVVADGATNTLSNVTNTFTGDLTVGTNGSFTLLVLSDNALLTNSVNGIIGRNATAKSNEVQLISSTARWQMGGSIFVGSNGASSRLVVSNGAFLENLNGNLGFLTASSNNSALITGPGSLWTNRGSFSISGAFLSNSRSNQLVVSDSAALVSGGTARVGGIGSQVLITGAGSRLASQSEFTLGGTDNRVDLSDGGGLVSSNAIIGDLASGNTNTFLLTGPGTAWTNGGNLTMGFSSARGVLTASNGATMFVAGRAFIGANSGANFNSVSITDPGTLWTIGSDLSVGGGSSGNLLTIRNGGLVVSSNAFVGGASLGASANSALVTGAGSVWSNRNHFYIGDADGGNQLVVSNGATVLTGSDAVLGARFGANANSAIVTDPDSRWLVASHLYVGSNSALNRLVITNGGTVLNAHLFYLGYNAGANSNTATVTGSGSAFTNLDYFFIGQGGIGNQLVVSNGAKVYIGGLFTGIGYDPGASNNAALITGTNSRLQFSSDFNDLLFIGRIGTGNRVTVSGGGAVSAPDHTVLGFSSSANELLVTGTNSIWTGGDTMSVGQGGGRNRLVVSDGGTFECATNIIVGEFAGSTNNSVLVDAGMLRVTNVAGNGTLNIRRGTNVLNAGLIDVDLLVVTNRGTNAVFSSFGNSSSLTIPTGSTASQYPSIINVAGIAGNTIKVTVTLSNLSHTFPQDLDILLVNPSGQKVMLMSDCGGGNDLSTVRLTFEDGQNNLPAVALITTGTYRPTDFETGETMPGPAPVGPYSVTLSSFNGTSPVGSWRLYINDDANPDSGSMVGWSLRIATDAGPHPDGGGFDFNGGTLITRGAMISNGAPFIVGTSGTTPAVWDVRAGVTNTFVSGELMIGSNASFSQLILTNGALLTNSSSATLGRQVGANSNNVTLAGTGSQWLLNDSVLVGRFGSGNRLVVSNGAALVTGSFSTIGHEFLSTNNEAVITGPGSTWFSSVGQLSVGNGGRNNRLLVSDGAQVTSFIGRIGDAFADTTNNIATVTGPGSSWRNSSDLYVGNVGARNQLVVSNGATVFAGTTAFVGFASTSTNNRITVDGGTLRVTNASVNGTLDVRRGNITLTAGLVEVNRLLLTNTLSQFSLNGGTLSTRSTTVASGIFFHVGNNIGPATLFLAGNGTHGFGSAMEVDANSTLAGNGTIAGVVVIASGAALSPGASIGKIVLTNSPFLLGTVFMEISKNGAVLTNDQIQVTAPLTYGGSLTVSNLGPSALAAGDNFKLFNATSFAGSFAPLTLPPLSAGLGWTNKLLVDGSIEVVGVAQPKFTSVTRSGNNLIFSGTNGAAGQNYAVLTATNVTTPATNWQSLFTNQFGAGGQFSFTNAIAPGEPQRFFRIRTP